MNKKATRQQSADAALSYLISKGAVAKLTQTVPVLGSSLCIWLPKRLSNLAFDLPPLRR